VLSYPRVDGSTSAHPLGMLVACRLLGAEYEWTNKYKRPHSYYGGYPEWRGFESQDYLVQYRALAKVLPPEKTRLGAIINQQVVVHTGTHGSYVTLMDKKSDLILAAREPLAAEIEAAKQKGVAFDVRPVALDAFVFIVNRANPVRGLTTKQLKAIYTRKVKKWNEVGGPDATISAFQRNATSGSQGLMLSVFMKGDKITTGDKGWTRRMISSGMGGPFHKLTRDHLGIGYSVYFYEHFMSASPYTRTLAVDGVIPGYGTIRSGKYPYVTKVYVAVRKDQPATSSACKLRDWLLTDEGQAVVQESGYVPLPKP
jgi:ABC-type phosphate transport system substrate-binding protein